MNDTTTTLRPAVLAGHGRATALLLNIAHALDHLMLLIFATAVGAIALDFGQEDWHALMPFVTGAFVMFGLGSIPAGRLGDVWGRRPMMLVFFFGIGISSIAAGLTQGPWHLGTVLTVLGAFAAIYHPVGIPMLLQGAHRPGVTIGINGFAGNLGIAAAALTTGLLVQGLGWRWAFFAPGVVSILCGIAFALATPVESEPPARRKRQIAEMSRAGFARVLVTMLIATSSGAIVFNLTTNGNGELLRERFLGLIDDPATLGAMLAGVYVMASLAQIAVGRAIDRFSLRHLYMAVAAAQVPLFLLAAHAQGWAFYALAIGFMVFVFGAIPFVDAIIVRYFDDQVRSRVAGFRLGVTLGLSSLAVWLLGPVVKVAGFDSLLIGLAICSTCTAFFAAFLPPPPVASGR
jgi:MFS family permease